MEALQHLESLRCPCGCGNYVDEARSREWNWDVNHVKCYAGAALEQVQRMYRKDNQGVEGSEDGLLWTVEPVAPSN